ncbi:MAG: DUF1254 domain-containing protein [Pseudomonadota bacterium]
MISRRTLIAGTASGVAVAATGAGFIFSSAAKDLRSALLYAYGLYEFAHRMQILSLQIQRPGTVKKTDILAQYPTWKGEPILNRQLHRLRQVTHEAREITTPNNDTLYTSAVLSLGDGPVEVTVPDVETRYLSVAFMDAFSDQIAYIGTRATQGKGGRFWVYGPGQTAATPEGVTAIQSTTNDLWMLARVFVAGSEDLPAAQEVQQAITAQPVDPRNTGTPFTVTAPERPDPGTFLALTNELLSRSPLQGEALRARDFAHLGIDPGNRDAFAQLPRLKRELWSRGIEGVEQRIMAHTLEQQETTNGWTMPPAVLGRYGIHDDVRSAVAVVGFGALTLEEAAYFKGLTDSSGASLDGRKKYRMVIPASGIPAKAFWSLSMYAVDADNRQYFYRNALNRYAINSHSEDLLRQVDGSIVLALQSDRPADPSVVWMPTPDSIFNCVFRTYLPGEPIVEGQWTPPPLVQVS